jgi:hypothetical protein
VERVNEARRPPVLQHVGKTAQPTAAILDSQDVRVVSKKV